MLAQLTACVCNFSMSQPKKPLHAEDFMPSQWAKKARSKSDEPTDEERRMIGNQMRGIMEALMKRGEKKK